MPKHGRTDIDATWYESRRCEVLRTHRDNVIPSTLDKIRMAAQSSVQNNPKTAHVKHNMAAIVRNLAKIQKSFDLIEKQILQHG